MNNDFRPAIVSAQILQGSDATEVFQLFSDVAKTIPMDLTGLSARSHIRTNHDSSIVLSLTSPTDIIIGAVISNGVITQGPETNGCIAITYNNLSTSGIKFKGDSLKCVRDIELYDDTNVKRIVEGPITILREITR